MRVDETKSQDSQLVTKALCPWCGEREIVYNGNYWCQEQECGWVMDTLTHATLRAPADQRIIDLYLIQRQHAQHRR